MGEKRKTQRERVKGRDKKEEEEEEGGFAWAFGGPDRRRPLIHTEMDLD